MRLVTPAVYLLSQTDITPYLTSGRIKTLPVYLKDIGVPDWDIDEGLWAPDIMTEVAGRVCYRSFAVGLNPNVTKIREGNKEYLENILKSHHGSVLEHSAATFLFKDVSRVLTHELVRHRVGVAISQESMRYVRLTDIPFWMPSWAKEDVELMGRCEEVLRVMEAHQDWMAKRFNLDGADVGFAEKKHKTSFMRRFAPHGVATSIMWTANFRALRHVIETRTSLAAEEEIRMLFDEVAKLCVELFGGIFQDFQRTEEGEWVPKYSKV